MDAFPLEGARIGLRNYKCFRDEPAVFPPLCRFNIVVGRNNAGKSALLDAVEATTVGTERLGNVDAVVTLTVPIRIPDDIRQQVTRAEADFAAFTTGNQPDPQKASAADMVINRFRPLLPYDGLDLEYYVSRFGGGSPHAIEHEPDPPTHLPGQFTDYAPYPFATQLSREETQTKVVRLSADRDLQPGERTSPPSPMAPGGGNASSLFADVFVGNEPSRPERGWILRSLNEIVQPDASFEDISMKQLSPGNSIWEINLVPKGGNDVPLSSSGSGLRTVLLVLLALLTAKSVQQRVLILEELENNLHPAILRRLLAFIKREVIELNAILFLSTHSGVVLDHFAEDADALVIRVQGSDSGSTISSVGSRRAVRESAADLGLRASDVLLAAGVVWVEGISDRILINKWMDIYCANENRRRPRENVDYLMMEYGGRCLSHFEFSGATGDGRADSIDEANLIEVLSLNPNYYVVMDSDVSRAGAQLRSTKSKIIELNPQLVWITAGYEIENYIPAAVLAKTFKHRLTKHQSVASVMKARGQDSFDKKAHARKAAELLTSGALTRYDLRREIGRLVDAIDLWRTLE